MELRQLRYLISIVDFGSFSRASAQLNIAQPALSQQIANLEAELDTPLLIRSSRGVTATEAGLRLYKQARVILSQVNQAMTEAKLSDFGDQFAGSVAVGLPPSASALLGLPFIRQVAENYPGIHLRLVESQSGYLLEMLLKNRLDMALQFAREPFTGIQIERLLEEDLFLVTADATHAGEPIELSELEGHTISIPGAMHAVRTTVDRACEKANVKLKVAVEVDSQPVLCWLVATNFSDAILPLSALLGPVPVPGLYSRPIVNPTLSRTLSLCVAEGAPRSRAMVAAEEILRFLIKEFVEEGTWKGARLHPELGRKKPDKSLQPQPKRQARTDRRPA